MNKDYAKELEQVISRLRDIVQEASRKTDGDAALEASMINVTMRDRKYSPALDAMLKAVEGYVKSHFTVQRWVAEDRRALAEATTTL